MLEYNRWVTLFSKRCYYCEESIEYPYYDIPLTFHKEITNFLGGKTITSDLDYSIARCEKCYNSHISILQKRVGSERKALIRGTYKHPLLKFAKACGCRIHGAGFGLVNITTCLGIEKEKEAKKLVNGGLKKQVKEKYNVALDSYELALKIFKKIGLGQSEYVKDLKGKIEYVKKDFALNLNEIAKRLHEKGNFHKAIENYEKAVQLLTEIGLGQSQNTKKIRENLNTLKNKRGHYEFINSLDDIRKISNNCSMLLYIVNTGKGKKDETKKLFENKVLPKIKAMVKNKNILIAWTDLTKINISYVDFTQFFKNNFKFFKNRKQPSLGCFLIQNGEIIKYKMIYIYISKSYIKAANYVLGNE